MFGTYLCADITRHINRFLCMFLWRVLAIFALFFSTFCHFFHLWSSRIAHIYMYIYSTFDFFDFCRTFCGFFRRANCRLPTQNLVWTLTSAHELGNWATELSQAICYMLYAICYMLHMWYTAIWSLMERGACSSKIARWLPRPFTDIYDLRTHGGGKARGIKLICCQFQLISSQLTETQQR